VRRWLAIAGAVGVVAAGAATGGIVLLASHHAPGAFTLSSPAPASAAPLVGAWKVGGPSEAGYRAREKFINQPSTTEAVARTSRVSGGLRIKTEGGSYVATSIDVKVDLGSLVSQDRYATYQAFQRDFFVSRIYLDTSAYPIAEFKADSARVALDLAPGPVDLEVPGTMSAHGVTKKVTAELRVQVTGDELEVVGSMNIDMRDFNVDPPDISFTKAESAVVIEYHLFLSRV
jgi:polyisoprenoid-binding protein YceI